mmetsp:Transcript_4371/g.7206  ORF Transcript_4371/g.7206 Transcript_4371/m.7206 type:complete len:113 (-) Transcript_4371:313-651(-)
MHLDSMPARKLNANALGIQTFSIGSCAALEKRNTIHTTIYPNNTSKIHHFIYSSSFFSSFDDDDDPPIPNILLIPLPTFPKLIPPNDSTPIRSSMDASSNVDAYFSMVGLPM